jgi:Holliday junction resolvase RusA-like endonuclease
MIRKRFMKESDYNDYKERISDYLDENGLWVDDKQLDELSHSIGNRDYNGRTRR